MEQGSATQERALVWDLPLRLFHWLFAASILACWGTAKLGFGWMKWHFWLGYWVIGLLLFRLIWGLAGPKHSRFASFIKGPRAILAYARSFAQTHPDPVHAGHNPLGALMVVLMLLLVAVQASSGLFSTDDIAWAGPYNPSVSSSMADRLTTVHHWNFDFIWIAIGLHLAAILFYLTVKKENLVSPMLTGRKSSRDIPAGASIRGSAPLRALAVAMLAGALVFLILHGAPPPPSSADF